MSGEAEGALIDALVGLGRRLGLFERDAICCGDVTVPQCVALQRLLDGAADVSALAAHLGVTPSAATRQLDVMERRGWLVRERDASDRRRVVLQLTAQGRAQAECLRAATSEMLGVVLGRIPAHERDNVARALGLLREALDASMAELRGCCGPAGCGDD